MKVAIVANFVKRGVPANQAFLTASGLVGREGVDEVRLVHSDPLMMLGYGGDIEYSIRTTDGDLKVIYPSMGYSNALDVDLAIFHYMPFHMKKLIEELDAKKVLVAHFNLYEYFIEDRLRSDIPLILDFASAMDTLVAVSEYQRRLLAEIIDVPVVHIPPMIDHKSLFNIGHQPDMCTFAVVGRLVTVKSHLLPILAAKHLPARIGINIYGEGPLFDFYRKIIHDLKLYGKVTLRSELRHDRLIKELSRATALIHCSITENFPVVLLEAKAIGLPIIQANPLKTTPKELASIIQATLDDYDSVLAAAEQNIYNVVDYDYHNIAPKFLKL